MADDSSDTADAASSNVASRSVPGLSRMTHPSVSHDAPKARLSRCVDMLAWSAVFDGSWADAAEAADRVFMDRRVDAENAAEVAAEAAAAALLAAQLALTDAPASVAAAADVRFAPGLSFDRCPTVAPPYPF